MFYLECIDLFEEVYHNDDFTGLRQYLFHSGFCPLSDKELDHGIAGLKEFERKLEERKLEERKLKKQRARLPESDIYYGRPFEAWVDKVLMTHHAVKEVEDVVIKRGDIVEAHMVLKPNYQPSEELIKEIQDFAKERIELYKYPRETIQFTTDYYPGGELLPALVQKDLGYPRKYSTPSIDLNIAFRFCLGVSRLVSTSNIFLPKPKLGSLDWAKVPLDWGKKLFSWRYEEERKRKEKKEREEKEERRERRIRKLKAWKKRKAKRAKELRKNLTTLGGLLLLTICSWAVWAPLGSLFHIGNVCLDYLYNF